MIHNLVKIIVVNDFFTSKDASQIVDSTYHLQYQPTQFGEEIPNFNMVSDDIDSLFNKILNTNVEVNKEQSGIFRKPSNLIHFESFRESTEWIFMVALQPSTLNIFEHKSGAEHALEGYKFNYRNLFEWDLQINHLLKPGQGVLFRPWLFHSFDTGLIQIFKLKEIDILTK